MKSAIIINQETISTLANDYVKCNEEEKKYASELIKDGLTIPHYEGILKGFLLSLEFLNKDSLNRNYAILGSLLLLASRCAYKINQANKVKNLFEV